MVAVSSYSTSFPPVRNTAARISDRTAVFLTGGKLVEYDDTATIFENPADDRVEDYITGKFG